MLAHQTCNAFAGNMSSASPQYAQDPRRTIAVLVLMKDADNLRGEQPIFHREWAFRTLQSRIVPAGADTQNPAQRPDRELLLVLLDECEEHTSAYFRGGCAK